jgi:hypothetical protein
LQKRGRDSRRAFPAFNEQGVVIYWTPTEPLELEKRTRLTCVCHVQLQKNTPPHIRPSIVGYKVGQEVGIIGVGG